MFYFFSEGKEAGVTCKQFVVKYCVLTKCPTAVFLRILFEIFKESDETHAMGEAAFANFAKAHAQYFGTAAEAQQFPITVEGFADVLTRSEFKARALQGRLSLITEAELPFAEIGRELLESEFRELAAGSSYFLLSNKWYYRW